MGKIKDGVYGGVSGKIGNLVGSSWKGIPYMRVNPQTVSNPRTNAQQAHRAKISLVTKTLKQLSGYVNCGFKNEAVGMTAYNAAYSYTLRYCVKGEYPDLGIDWEQFMVSRGNLPNVEQVQVERTGRTVAFRWDATCRMRMAKRIDMVMPVLFNVDKGQALYGMGNTRASGQCVVEVPSLWEGDVCMAYVAVFAVDSDEVSDSIWLGEL